RLFVYPMRYDPKRRKPPHSKFAQSHSKNKGQTPYYTSGSDMSEISPTSREVFGVRGSAPLWFERRLSLARRRLFVYPMRYDPKRRKPPHSKFAQSHSKN